MGRHDQSPGPQDPDDPILLTTLHVRRARAGDGDSLAWIVERFTPVLMAQARYRLPGALSSLCEPADVVQDVWVRVLPRLGDLGARDGRHTPVLLAYLSTALLRRVNALLARHVGGKPARVSTDDDHGAPTLAAETLGVVRRAALGDAHAHVLERIESLPDGQREVFVLRGIEQRELADVAELLGISTNLASQRYRRALAELRARLPRSFVEELEDD